METPSPFEQIRRQLALSVGENAVFDGWSAKAAESAAVQMGVDPAQARVAMPKNATGLIDIYTQAVDRELEVRFTPERIAALKIRARIRSLVWERLEIMAPAREAIRSALSILAMPQNVPLAVRMGWRTADVMWRIAGDTSTDFNHYTKRLTLSGVYGTTLLAWMDDRSEGWTETGTFLDRRIDNVMQFEKVKAQWRGQERFSPTRFLGRLRYPPR